MFPSLILNYAGQAAIVLDGAPTDGNIFYRLCPAWFLIPMVILATLATIIASQAIITGAYSMTRQAIQLGWLPRLAVKQTSSEGYGQILILALGVAPRHRAFEKRASRRDGPGGEKLPCTCLQT